MKIAFLNKLGKWRWPVAIVASLMIIISGTIFVRSASVPDIATAPVEYGEFVIDLKERGELEAVKSVAVGVPRRVRGNLRVTGLVEDGAMVEKGDFLIQFDTSEAMQDVEERKNELENAKAELKSLTANIKSTMSQLQTAYETQKYSYEQAQLRYEQMQYEAAAKRREQELNLKKAELALEQARKKIESQKIINAADLQKAEIQVKQKQMRLVQKQGELDDLTLKAPTGGLVVLKEIWGPNGMAKVKIGDTPWRGMTLVEIPDLSQMKVKAKTNEVNISKVAVGQQVILNIDALPGPAFYGKVNHVATLATRERGSNVKVFELEILIDGSDPRLRPGMTAQCRIVTDKIADQLYVPLESVFQKDDTTVVYIQKGGFHQRKVKVGDRNSDFVIVKSGLSEGENVALRDPTLPLEKLGGEGETVKPGKKKQSNQSESIMIIG